MQAEELLIEEPAVISTLEQLFKSMDDDKGDDFPPIIIRLTDVAESNWIKEGTENTQHPEYLSAPSLYCIMPYCKVALYKNEKDKAEGRYTLEDIRYIQGCNSLDVKWQKENGIEPSQDKKDNIWIQGGTETFLRVGSDAVLYDYIRLYQGNANNPHRPPTAEIEFEQIIDKEEAELQNVDFALTRKAINIVGGLQKELPGGKGYEYDADKIDVFAAIFNILDLPSAEERFNHLAQLAQSNPKVIVDSVMNRKKDLIATVKQAVDLSVIVFDAEKVFFCDDNNVIMTFPVKMDKPTQINKLTDHFLTAIGSISYRQLIIKVEVATKKALQ